MGYWKWLFEEIRKKIKLILYILGFASVALNTVLVFIPIFFVTKNFVLAVVAYLTTVFFESTLAFYKLTEDN